MKEKLDAIWRLITRIFWLVLLGVTLVALAALFAPKYVQYNELSQRVHAMQETNRELATAIRRLESNQRRIVSDRAFAERTARELGMAKPDEIVFKYFPSDTD